MSADIAAAARASRTFRVDAPGPDPRLAYAVAVVVVAAAAIGFVWAGGEPAEPDAAEARLGAAVGERFGPIGQTFGGWDPGVRPLPLALSKLTARFNREVDPSAIRWPSAIAALGIGVVLMRRSRHVLGLGAGVGAALAWYSSVAAVDRTGLLGLDMLTGLGTVAALDRVVGDRCDARAGLWAGVAFLGGGWPPVALILLATVVLDRRESRAGPAFLATVLGLMAAWSAWCLAVAPVGAWRSSWTLPLSQGSAPWLVPGVLALALPGSPLAALAGSAWVRAGWKAPGRALVLNWLRVWVAAALAGSIVPGMAAAARVPMLAAIAVAAGAAAGRLVSARESVPAAPRRALAGSAVMIAGCWAFLAIAWGGRVALAMPFYRPGLIVVAILAATALVIALSSARRGDAAAALIALAVVAVGVKVAHASYYVPERNYRFGQGPWGRAIGQWVPPRQPIYVTTAWPAELAFATGHPFRQIRSPGHLRWQSDVVPKYVLLHPSEFAHWPDSAAPLMHVFTFHDEFGGRRVLARTTESFSWKKMAEDAKERGD